MDVKRKLAPALLLCSTVLCPLLPPPPWAQLQVPIFQHVETRSWAVLPCGIDLSRISLVSLSSRV